MSAFKAVFCILLVAACIAVALFNSGCANIIPPTGGPRDSLPPVLVSAIPADSSIHFKDNKIVLTFDEYVQLDTKLNEELIVSPNPEQIPTVLNRLKTVTIRLKDSLLPNTTYAIDFGNSIKDVNEGNPYRNFTYVFSTGDHIDEGTLSGKVLIAATGEPDSTLIVALYKNLSDSAVKKHRPDYYTRIDSGGNFRFRFLPPSDFNIYVLENDYAKRYDDSTKLFAFYNSRVNPETTEKINLFAFRQAEPAENRSGTPAEEDKKKEKNIRIFNNLEGEELDLLSNLELTTSERFDKFDTAAIILSDTNFVKIKDYTLKADTSKRSFFVSYQWTENTAYILTIGKEALVDSNGNSLAKADTIRFTTKKESQYGSIRLHFNNLDLSRNPVLQLLQNDKVVQSVILSSADWYQKLYRPGEYSLRILWDENKNGVWDTGNFAEKIQPERVSKISRKINVRANWDNEIDINL